MKHTLEEVEEKEVDFYVLALEKAMDYAKHGKTEGTEVRQLIAMTANVAKIRQSRSADNALQVLVQREKQNGSLPKQFQIEQKSM